MTSLPTGTVTFFMSDIEGSTRLVGRLGSEFPLDVAGTAQTVPGQPNV